MPCPTDEEGERFENLGLQGDRAVALSERVLRDVEAETIEFEDLFLGQGLELDEVSQKKRPRINEETVQDGFGFDAQSRGMTQTRPLSEVCQRCGCPLAGNESYCSHCGQRLDPPGWRGLVLILSMALVALGAVGTCVYRSRPAEPLPSSPRSSPTRFAS